MRRPLIRFGISSIGWIVGGLVLGFVLAQYVSGRLLTAFLQKLPGCY